MKTLNLKKYLLHFTFVLLVASMMTSCTTNKEEDNLKPTNIETEQLELKQGLLLPIEITKQGEEVIANYISRATEDQRLVLHNNFVIYQYLDFFGKTNDLIKEDTDLSDLSKLNLKNVLSEQQLTMINDSLKTEISTSNARTCVEVPVYHTDPCCYTHWDNCQSCTYYVGTITIC